MKKLDCAGIVFLDFDGVLNSDAWFDKPGVRSMQFNTMAAIDPETVARLSRITQATGAVVVITSSWRQSDHWRTLGELLKALGFEGRVIGALPWYEPEHFDLPEETYWSNGRGLEIAVWLEQNLDADQLLTVPIAILDDDADMWILADRLVQTSAGSGGLLDEHVDRAVELLKRPLGGLAESGIARLATE